MQSPPSRDGQPPSTAPPRHSIATVIAGMEGQPVSHFSTRSFYSRLGNPAFLLPCAGGRSSPGWTSSSSGDRLIRWSVPSVRGTLWTAGGGTWPERSSGRVVMWGLGQKTEPIGWSRAFLPAGRNPLHGPFFLEVGIHCSERRESSFAKNP